MKIKSTLFGSFIYLAYLCIAIDNFFALQLREKVAKTTKENFLKKVLKKFGYIRKKCDLCNIKKRNKPSNAERHKLFKL